MDSDSSSPPTSSAEAGADPAGPPTQGQVALASSDAKDERSDPSPTKDIPGRLTKGELVERMSVFSPSLVEELHRTAQRQLDAEDRRENVLTTKAGTLLAQSGLAITVAGAIVGLIVKEPDLVERLGSGWIWGLGIGYLLVFTFGLIAAVFAMRVVLVRGDFEELNEGVVFDQAELRKADSPLAHKQSTEQAESTVIKVDADANTTAITRYRRWMTPHIWSIYQRHNLIHDEKAKLLKRGQLFFAGFVVGITLFVPVMTFALLANPARKNGNEMTSKTPETPAPAPASPAASQAKEGAEQPAIEQPRPMPTTVPPAGQRFQGSDPATDAIKLNGGG